MEAWEKWWQMAQDSQQAARLLAERGYSRPSASRHYYAAYQAATLLLLYRHTTPPQGREAWSHETTPGLLEESLEVLGYTRDERSRLASRLRMLYKLRVDADYMAGRTIGQYALDNARKDAGYIMALVDKKVTQGRKNV